jgi:hypothetical protein
MLVIVVDIVDSGHLGHTRSLVCSLSITLIRVCPDITRRASSSIRMRLMCIRKSEQIIQLMRNDIYECVVT